MSNNKLDSNNKVEKETEDGGIQKRMKQDDSAPGRAPETAEEDGEINLDEKAEQSNVESEEADEGDFCETRSGNEQPATEAVPNRPQLSGPGAMRYGETRNSPDDADLTDAMVFLNRIKEDYAHDVGVYDQFLETMRDFKFGKVDSTDVCKRIKILFKDNAHLIRSFEEYLPHHLKMSGKPPVVAAPRQMPPPGAFHAPAAEAFYRPPYAQPRPFPIQPRPPRPYQPIPAHPMALPQKGAYFPGEQPYKKDRQRAFIEKLKKKYSPNNTIYSNIIDAMLNQHIDVDSLLRYVRTLLKDDHELFEEFKACCDPEHRQIDKLPRGTREKLVLDKIRHIMNEKGLTPYFAMALNFYNQALISGEKLFFLIGQLIDNDEYVAELKNFLKWAPERRKTAPEQPGLVGSYAPRASPEKKHTAMGRVLNDKFYSVNTHVSEDDVYVFRQKNASEEFLVRIGDDRSEFDVQIQRLKFFICRLMKLHALLPEAGREIEIGDVDMSPGILKDVLRMIYGDEATGMLEKMLQGGKNVIPRIIRRCCVVYKEFLTRQRENRLNWRISIEAHYFKAYDFAGIEYRNDERGNLNMKHLKRISRDQFDVRVGSRDSVRFVHGLVEKFVLSNYNPSKRVTVEQKTEFFENVLTNILAKTFEYSVSLEYYALYFYILTLYTRFEEMRGLQVRLEAPSAVALRLGLVEPAAYDDPVKAVFDLSMRLASREIDSDAYEEQIRIYTKTRGYKLYNLKKFLGKIDKLAISIIEKSMDKNDEGMDLFHIQKENHVIMMKRGENATISEDGLE
ncbi:transcriptional regulator_like prt [Enterospora canceri]|uniref:Transcriptional regulator_like prt n=1 Tax=Enterospora canceri TaxID=1081671 RepID=A0A1Y1SAU7_9MICR|nr:transcriptional regulator_like prt [Enterospora canceri]